MIHYLVYITHPLEFSELVNYADGMDSDKERIVCVCDGGDPDLFSQADQHSSKGLDLINLRIPLGMGVAISAGMNRIVETAGDDDCIIACHAADLKDNTFKDGVIEKLNDGHEVVIGSRYFEEGGYVHFPATRKYFSQKVNTYLRDRFFFRGVRDYTVFTRGYKVSLIRKAFEIYGKFGLVQSRGYVANAELLVKLSFISDKLIEVPVRFNFNKLITRSSIGIIRTINEYVVLVDYLKRIREKLDRKALLI